MYYLLDIISKGTVVALVLSDFEDGGSSVVLTVDVDVTGGVQPELVRLENNNTLVIPIEPVLHCIKNKLDSIVDIRVGGAEEGSIAAQDELSS